MWKRKRKDSNRLVQATRQVLLITESYSVEPTDRKVKKSTIRGSTLPGMLPRLSTINLSVLFLSLMDGRQLDERSRRCPVSYCQPCAHSGEPVEQLVTKKTLLIDWFS